MCFSLPDAEITYLQSFSIFNAKGLRQSVSLHCHSQARIKEDYVCLFSTGDFFFSHSLLGS
ncbi:hypothetical protein CIPAW_07G162200 [Carya illinoinensis]|uniref:Uncharacterized protein n=1 Tax=Carya illinoinensis TaxID=32201 RepID=A0A8T1PWS2_CARIL|nr:hypothetical protein CIPAW_07G162200 [Carya illinoinensis]